MKRILFIGSLNTKKDHYDGERIKTTLTYDVLNNYFDVKVINLSKNKLVGVFKFVMLVLFHKSKFDYIVISKDRGGAKTLHKILYMFHFDMKKVIYFQIGPFLFDLVKNSSDMKRLFVFDKFVTVETDSLKSQLETIGFKNVKVLPNFKPAVDLVYKKMCYPKPVLKLVYFSRIEEKKGIYQLIESLIDINSEKVEFELDIYGMFMDKKDKNLILNYCNLFNWIHYCGRLSLKVSDDYKKLQDYDFHVFPTLYGEGFPGSIIDFFIAGVPTLSSTFARSKEILTTNETIFYEQGSCRALKGVLKHIFDNQDIIESLRRNSFKRKEEFTPKLLSSFIEKELLTDEK